MTRVAAFVLSLLVSAAALGQPYPNRPIRMVVPFEAAGSMDAVARVLVEPWSEHVKQRIVIDNRGGAGGTVGTTIVAKAPADGYTILYANLGPLSIGPSLYRKLGYDVFKDLAPVSLVGSSPIIIFVSTALPVQLRTTGRRRPSPCRRSPKCQLTDEHMRTCLSDPRARIALRESVLRLPG